MDTVAGVYFPDGGMHTVAQAMADAAAHAGATLHLDTTVTALETSGGRVGAVLTAGGQRITCDAVVLTPDLPVVDELHGRPHRRHLGMRWSPSAVVLHGGVPRAVTAGWPNSNHHTIDFGAAWDQTFTEIIAGGRGGRGRLMSEPSLLITRPSLTDATVAPAGQELCYLLAPCPNLHTAPLNWGSHRGTRCAGATCAGAPSVPDPQPLPHGRDRYRHAGAGLTPLRAHRVHPVRRHPHRN